jgi:CRP-like cAMP-binding protein
MASTQLKLEIEHFLCKAGDTDTDMYKIIDGELLVFVLKGSQVTPLAYLTQGEYVGELSYFDHKPKSAYVIATKETRLKKISNDLIDQHFPEWMKKLAIDITGKLRTADELIRQKGIRRTKTEGIAPLSIEEQSRYYKLTQA